MPEDVGFLGGYRKSRSAFLLRLPEECSFLRYGAASSSKGHSRVVRRFERDDEIRGHSNSDTAPCCRFPSPDDEDRCGCQRSERAAIRNAQMEESGPKAKPPKFKAGQFKLRHYQIDLYHRAKEPDLTRDQIESAFVELERLDLTVAQLQALASRIDINQKFRAKKALVDRMRTAILERKGAFDWVQV